MHWRKSRDIIKSKCNNLGNKLIFTKFERLILLAENNYTCRYCGGVYYKCLIIKQIGNVNDIMCWLCYLVTHLNSGHFRETKLYYSKMSQKKIIKKTVDFIIENNEIPLPTKIDENIKLTPISLLEYINILNNTNNLSNEFQNYKIFFSNKLSIDFILYNYGNCFNLFVNDDNINIDTDIIPIDKTLPLHIPSDEEIQFFKKCFNNYNFEDNMLVHIEIAEINKIDTEHITCLALQ